MLWRKLDRKRRKWYIFVLLISNHPKRFKVQSWDFAAHVQIKYFLRKKTWEAWKNHVLRISCVFPSNFLHNSFIISIINALVKLMDVLWVMSACYSSLVLNLWSKQVKQTCYKISMCLTCKRRKLSVWEIQTNLDEYLINDSAWT